MDPMQFETQSFFVSILSHFGDGFDAKSIFILQFDESANQIFEFGE